MLAIVCVLLARIVDEPCPAAPNTDDAISLAQRSNGDGPNGGVEAGDVAAPGEDCNGSFRGWHARKISLRPASSGASSGAPSSAGTQAATGGRRATRVCCLDRWTL